MHSIPFHSIEFPTVFSSTIHRLFSSVLLLIICINEVLQISVPSKREDKHKWFFHTLIAKPKRGHTHTNLAWGHLVNCKARIIQASNRKCKRKYPIKHAHTNRHVSIASNIEYLSAHDRITFQQNEYIRMKWNKNDSQFVKYKFLNRSTFSTSFFVCAWFLIFKFQLNYSNGMRRNEQIGKNAQNERIACYLFIFSLGMV